MTQTKKIQKYLQHADSTTRIKILLDCIETGESLPIYLADDLLCLGMSEAEQIAIIRCTNDPNKLHLEDFLTKNLNKNPNIASICLKEWAKKTDCVLWHRCLPLLNESAISQRMSYTLLEIIWSGPSEQYLHRFSMIESLEELSPTFLSILYYRALQWSFKSEKLLQVARTKIQQFHGKEFSADTSFPYVLNYFLKYAPRSKTPIWKAKLPGIWLDIVAALDSSMVSSKKPQRLKKINDKIYEKDFPGLQQVWIELWVRSILPSQTIANALEAAASHQWPCNWEFFAGISSNTLKLSLDLLSSKTKVFFQACKIIFPLLGQKDKNWALATINKISPSSIEKCWYRYLPSQLAIELKACTHIEKSEAIQQELRQVVDQEFHTTGQPFPVLFPIDISQLPQEDRERRRFIDLSYRGIESESKDPVPGFWNRLLAAWKDPNIESLDSLAIEARQKEAVYHLCYIFTLGKFQGHDAATLKLLDYIRTIEEDLLTAVIRSLAGIGTKRAHLEIIAFLTRPNVSFKIQEGITQILKYLDLSSLQMELRSAISDLTNHEKNSSDFLVLKEALTDLLYIQEQKKPDSEKISRKPKNLDSMLGGKIETYSQLSSEAKRALRTAQFFHINIGRDHHQTIDLSPAIDMQYKALELTFREYFEAACTQVIQAGALQRKLDIIGYARPIKSAMSEFESYIENLPVINSIPFFSRFKLRKMLCAICQYRPGKRFTLDGLKAFSLFFICFSRTKCRYGLNHMLSIEGLSDDKLAEFCKSLHIFQDFRNRAAHEGFHPDASNDLDGIWEQTAAILKTSFYIKDSLTHANKEHLHTSDQTQQAIIVRKPRASA